MPENKNYKPPRINDHGKKRKKVSSLTPAPGNKEKSLAVSSSAESSVVSLLSKNDLDQTPGQLPKGRATGKKTRQQGTASDQKSKKHPKDSQTVVTVVRKTGGSKNSAHVTELSIQARESLRWEGVLHDPQEEARRLEQYRANRRQRYIAHRESQSQKPSGQTFLKESREKINKNDSEDKQNKKKSN